MDFILLAIPFFLILIISEIIADRVKGSGYYKFNDALSSLNLGILSRVTGILKAAIPLSAYYWLYHNYAFLELDQMSIAVWAFAFVAYDLGYYWVHRLSHRISVMWGSHVVHHSSEEYNLTTALRQTSTPAIFAWIIYLPMALVGISPELAVACGSLNLIYQFWVHTRHIDKMPAWFEAVFVTPSHHRVHHALNREYIDKNYAGVFILWDKWFGSFAEERDDTPVVYGVSNQLGSWNPIWANFQVYWNLVIDAFHTRGLKDKLKVFLKPPGWRSEGAKLHAPRKYVTTKNLTKYDVALDKGTIYYISVHFSFFIGLIVTLLLTSSGFSLQVNLGLCSLAIFHGLVISAMQERKSWVIWAEPARLVLTVTAIWFLVADRYHLVATSISVFILSLSLMCFFSIKTKESRHQKDTTRIEHKATS